MKMDRLDKFIILAFIILITSRFFMLNLFPIGISYDEMEYVLNAKAIFFTGKDVFQNWSPLSFTAIQAHGTALAELPSVILAPIIGLASSTLAGARLPYAINGILIVILIYLICNKLFDKKVALISLLLSIFNPWLFHFSRTAYEAPLAITFYLTAIYIFIKNKDWKLLWSLPFLILAFFSSHGTKMMIIPLVLVLLFWNYKYNFNKPKNIKPYFSILFITTLIFLFFVLTINNQPAGNRAKEFFIYNSSIPNIVNQERQEAIQIPINSLFINKLTYLVKYFITNYISAFSPERLFVYGDGISNSSYTFWKHGMFFILDFIFVILGIVIMYKKNYKAWLLLFILLIISPLPGVINKSAGQFSLRGALMFPLLIIFLGYGLKSFFSKYKSKLSIIAIGLIYFFSIINFLHLYFIQYPIYGSSAYNFDNRILAKYVLLQNQYSPNKNITIVSNEPFGIFYQLLFFNNWYQNKSDVLVASQALKQLPIRYKNVTIQNNCQAINYDDLVIYFTLEICTDGLEKFDTNYLSISSLTDSGEKFRILNDQLCSGVSHPNYYTVSNFNQLNIEPMSVNDFCSNWITKLSKGELSAF